MVRVFMGREDRHFSGARQVRPWPWPKPKASGAVLYDSGSSIQTARDIMKIYVDATDIAHWAGHSDRVTGIQRVELNIVRALARDHGGGVIRGVFFDRDSRAFYEFDPASLAHAQEFSAESLLIDLVCRRP